MFLLWPFKIIFKLTSLIATVAIMYLLFSAVQVVLASRSSSTPDGQNTADAVVLLVPRTGAVTTDLRGRLAETVDLFDAGVAHRIVLIPTTDSPVVALTSTAPLVSDTSMTYAVRYLSDHSVPSSDVSREAASSTYSGLLDATRQLGPTSKVAIVTDAVSVLWVSDAAKKAQLDVVHVYPAAGSKHPFYNEFGSLWRQASGVAIGRLIGYGPETWVNS